MKALDEFMKNVVCHIIKSHTLPILKLRNNYSEDEGKEDSIHFADSDDEDSKNPENFRLLTSCTLPGMRKITQIISIASLVSTLKKENRTIMLRDVYYSLKYLFESQDACNEAIFNLGKLLQLKRSDMNIIPSSKGLICGPLRFSIKLDKDSDDMDNWISADSDAAPDGLLIDSRWTKATDADLRFEYTQSQKLSAIILIEKECVFYHLLQTGILQALPSILITSCGYPDIATKAMLSRLSRNFPGVPVVGLCDYNPHGLALLLSFQYYSSRMASFEASGCTTPICWLGLRLHHIRNMLEYSDDTSVNLQPLTNNDISIVKSLLKRSFMQELPLHQNELLEMLKGGIKCEIESLYMLGLSTVTDFVCAAILDNDFI